MDSRNFFRVMSLFQEACGLDESARATFLDEACADSPDLRRDVEAMLAADAESGAIDEAGAGAHILAAHLAMASSADAGGSAPRATEPSMPPPQGLFAEQYRIIRLLGEGGMGTVYEAEQARPRRIVALKLIRQGLDSAGVLRRFEHEAHILGRLQHSGIAQIYEAGYGDGLAGRQAYIAMEYVDGRPLTEYAAFKGQTPRERLLLMIRVCDAIQHAHQRGVIHRDLKPANILVVEEDAGPAAEGSRSGESGRDSNKGSRAGSTGDNARVGQPKILDFGVAQAADPDQQLTTMHTVSGQIVGTLAYMSPEQVAGEPDQIDVRTDIYALGVVMYQLLTGKLPYDVKSKSIPEAVLVIRDAEVPTLSSVDTHYRGDVETIVAKALQKDKDRRYQSAAEMADDIRRHLLGEPISAKRDSAMYILRNRLRRYRLFLGVAAVFAIMVVGSIVWLSVLYQRQGRLLDEVEEQRDRAMAASRMANERLAEANQARDDEAMAKRLAEKAAIRSESINSFLQEMLASADPMLARGPELSVRELLDQSADRIESGSLSDQPEIEAETRLTLGRAYQRLEKYDKARHHLERALEINQKLYSEDSTYKAESLAELAELERVTGMIKEAERDSLEAVEMFRRLHARTRMYGIALNVRGSLLSAQSRFAEAEELMKECIAVWQEVHGREDIEVAGANQNLALIYMGWGREAEAEELLKKTAETFRAKLGPNHPYVGLALNNLGALAYRRGDIDGAERMLTEALKIRRHYFGAESRDAVEGMMNISLIQEAKGDLPAAERTIREALAIERRILKPDHPNLARTQSKLGMMLQSEKKLDEAEACFRSALEIRENALGHDHPEVGLDLSNLASLLVDRGKLEEAEKMHRDALEIRRKTLPAGHRDISSSAAMLSGLLLMEGRYEEAEPFARESLEIRGKVFNGHWIHAAALSRLGAILGGERKYEEAESLLLDAYKMIDGMKYVPPTNREEILLNLVEMYSAWGRKDQEKQWREKLAAHRAATSQPAATPQP